MSVEPYPLAFEPIFKSMLWGGERLKAFLGRQGGGDEPIGEAWVLSDVDGSQNRILGGAWAGHTLRDLASDQPQAIYGSKPPPDLRFPLLLKFIDARLELSVQVHPDDMRAVRLEGEGRRGKTEAWVVLEANPDASKIYAGLRPDVDPTRFESALRDDTLPELLGSFSPQPGDCVFLKAGTVHAIGAEILLFEVQQTSDITYRLYDWNRVDRKTGLPRTLHLEKGLTCVDFRSGPCSPIRTGPKIGRQTLVECEYFSLSRSLVEKPMRLTNDAGDWSAVVCLAGGGEVVWPGGNASLDPGGVFLIPAALREAEFRPARPTTLLECGPGRTGE